MNFKKIKNKTEFKKLVQSLFDKFGCVEEWEDFFGFRLKYNEVTGENMETLDEYKSEIEIEPKNTEYPVICAYSFSKEYDRFGDFGIRIFDWVSLEELK